MRLHTRWSKKMNDSIGNVWWKCWMKSTGMEEVGDSDLILQLREVECDQSVLIKSRAPSTLYMRGHFSDHPLRMGGVLIDAHWTIVFSAATPPPSPLVTVSWSHHCYIGTDCNADSPTGLWLGGCGGRTPMSRDGTGTPARCTARDGPGQTWMQRHATHARYNWRRRHRGCVVWRFAWRHALHTNSPPPP